MTQHVFLAIAAPWQGFLLHLQKPGKPIMSLLLGALPTVRQDKERLKVCLERAESLGLMTAAKAARRRLASRQASTATELQQAANSAPAAQVEALLVDAESLGLVDGAAQARSKLRKRQQAAVDALQAAALHATMADFQASEAVARELGADISVLSRQLAIFEARRAEARTLLSTAAESGTVAKFSAACQVARDLKLSTELAVAVGLMDG
eukprot:scaffold456639_cov37-Prasinocladus_malaysianus.AAC.1